MKVALVHDWLVTYRGGEKVLEAIAGLFPEAPIYTLFYQPEHMPPSLRQRMIHTPMGSRLLRPFRKALLPLLPTLVESFNLEAFDLVISTSSCVAKGALKSHHGQHLCYIHSPMRYVWDQMEEYIAGVKSIPGAEAMIRYYAPKMREWDVKSALRVDRFVANSQFVKERVHKYYGREATVVHPPINVNYYSEFANKSNKSGYLIAAGALVSYKRFDLAIAACERLQKQLVIAGSGPMASQLRHQAGKYTRFVMSPGDREFSELLAGAEALIFPGVEDFGMVAVEAMASGTPVIAYRAGGALDFMVEGETGVYFDAPTVESLASVLLQFKTTDFDRKKLLSWSQNFGYDAFKTKIKAEISHLC